MKKFLQKPYWITILLVSIIFLIVWLGKGLFPFGGNSLLGIGYVENYGTLTENRKTIEIDPFDIVFRHGIIGFLIYMIPFGEMPPYLSILRQVGRLIF